MTVETKRANGKTDIQVHFEIVVGQINRELEEAGKLDELELIYYHDNKFELNKIDKNGNKKYISTVTSAEHLSDFLNGMMILFKFE